MQRENGGDKSGGRGREQRQQLIDRAAHLEAEAATSEDPALRARLLANADIYRAAAAEEASATAQRSGGEP